MRASDDFDRSPTGAPIASEIRASTANIPVRNWFYMLLYAWDLADLKDELDAIDEDAPDLRALLTSLLARYTRRQIRRGLRGDYVDISEPLRTVRGRINITRTVGDLLLYKGQLHCDYQEYSLNIPRNQIIASTLNRQLMHDYHAIEQNEIGGLKAELESLVRTMSDIDRVHPTERLITEEMHKLGRNEREYRLIMQICQWLIRPRMPNENEAGQRFADIQWLVEEWRVYEKFVANFMKLHLPATWRVEPQKRLEWSVQGPQPEDSIGLPGMNPDIVLTPTESDGRVVIDTKWYSSPTSHHYGRETVHNSNLYQMWSYLSSQDGKYPERRYDTGILLYAQTRGGAKRLNTRIDSHPFRVHTLDLSQDWRKIEGDLLVLVKETTE